MGTVAIVFCQSPAAPAQQSPFKHYPSEHSASQQHLSKVCTAIGNCDYHCNVCRLNKLFTDIVVMSYNLGTQFI